MQAIHDLEKAVHAGKTTPAHVQAAVSEVIDLLAAKAKTLPSPNCLDNEMRLLTMVQTGVGLIAAPEVAAPPVE